MANDRGRLTDRHYEPAEKPHSALGSYHES